MKAAGRIFMVLSALAVAAAVFYVIAAKEFAGAVMLGLFSIALLYISTVLLRAGPYDRAEEEDAEPELGPAHMSGPSWAPIVMAVGTGIVVTGLKAGVLVVAVGVGVFLSAATLWFVQSIRTAQAHAAGEHGAPAATAPYTISPRVAVPVLALVEAAVVIALFAALLYAIPKGAAAWVSLGVGAGILAATVLVFRRGTLTGAVFRKVALFTVVPLAAAAIFANVANLNGGSASAAPAAAPSAGGGGTEIHLVAHDLAFGTDSLEFPSGATVTVDFVNEDKVPHNLAIYTTSKADTPLFTGDIVDGGTSTSYEIKGLAPGTYYFRCDVHPTEMHGRVVVG